MWRPIRAVQPLQGQHLQEFPPAQLAWEGEMPSNTRLFYDQETVLNMAIRIKARHNESVGQMLRRFKKLCEKEGLTKDIKRRQYFEKPSERRRRAQRKAVQRINRVQIPRGPR